MNQVRWCLTLSLHQRHLTQQAEDKMDLDLGHTIASTPAASPPFTFSVGGLGINVFAACAMVACVSATGKY